MSKKRLKKRWYSILLLGLALYDMNTWTEYIKRGAPEEAPLFSNLRKYAAANVRDTNYLETILIESVPNMGMPL